MFPVAILAGGLATRLGPITEKIPKALIDIGGEPFIAHQLRLLHANHISRTVICAGHLGESIRDVVGDGSRFGIHVDYSFDGPTLLGTAGAIKRALPKLGGAFFVLYGDSYPPCDFAAVQSAFNQSGKLALMAVFGNHGLWGKSNVEFEEGRLLAYDKRVMTARMHHIDYGLGVFRDRAFDRVPTGVRYDLELVYQDLLARKELAAFEVKERFYEIGSFEGVQQMTSYIMAKQGRL